MGRCGVEALRGPDDGVDDRRLVGAEVGRHEAAPLAGGCPRVRGGAGAVLPGQHAARERGPREVAQTQVLGRGDELLLDGAVEQRVLDLVGDEQRSERARRRRRRQAHLPAGEVGQADVADPPGGHGVLEGGQRLLPRRQRVPGVELPEVEVVGAQRAQRRVELGEQVAAGGVGDRVAPTEPDDALAGEHDLVADPALGDQVADQRLGAALAVDGSGVDERAAGVEERVELLLGLDLVDLGAEGHGAEPQPRDPQPRVTDLTLLHASTLDRRSTPEV